MIHTKFLLIHTYIHSRTQNALCTTKLSQANIDSETIICRSPFCQKVFHIACAGFRNKTKEELNSLYFVCLACDEYIKYSNSRLDQRIAKMEAKVNKTLETMNKRIGALEADIKTTTLSTTHNTNEIKNIQDNISETEANFSKKNKRRIGK